MDVKGLKRKLILRKLFLMIGKVIILYLGLIIIQYNYYLNLTINSNIKILLAILIKLHIFSNNNFIHS